MNNLFNGLLTIIFWLQATDHIQEFLKNINT